MYRVLIVDDDRLARQGIISMMPWEKYGMTVVGEAQNGEKALEALSQTSVDLLFVDLDMPVMDGISLMEKCHALYPGIFFVVLTFYEDFHHVQSALRIGAIDYISKFQMETIDCDQLLKRISEKVEDIMARQIARAEANKKDGIRHDSGCVGTARAFEEKEWQTLVKRWTEMHWLYDDSTFEELSISTRQIDISVRKVEQVLLPLIHHAQESIGIIIKNIPEFQNLDNLFRWLTEFREALYHIMIPEIKTDKTAKIS